MRRLLPCLILLSLALPATAEASPRQTVTFEAPRELLSASTRGETLDQITSFGIKNVRQLVYWRDIAPDPSSKTKPSFDASDPNAYPADKWHNLDGLIAAARERGVSVTLTLTGPVPRWATRDKKDNVSYPSPAEFGAFATAIGRRYGDAVTTWSIWNEPNQPQFLSQQYKRGKPYSPKLYRKLYQAAYAGLRATPANASDAILVGETSPRGNSNIVYPLAFLRGTLCLDSKYRKAKSCKRLETDGYAHHAYTTSAGPRWVPQDRDDVTIGVLPRLVTALDRAGKAGAIAKHLPIHLTEFGIQSTPDKVSGVSLERQAAYLAIAEHIAYVNPRVVTFSQYLLSDDSPRTSGYRYSGFESGLISAAGKKKPAYHGFRLPLAVERYGSSDVLWGLVRPERATTQVTIEYRTAAGKWRTLKTLKTTASGVYALKTKRKRHYRVRWGEYVGASVKSY
jgi:hypothetical protein